MTRWRDEIGERRLHAGRGISLSRAALGLAVFYILSLLLHGDALCRNAEQMPYGRVRDISLRLTLPLRCVSRVTGFARVREWIEQNWNKESAS